ncbi:la protein 1-like [Magnolia sinica]|uniref:la protein 1-like n=1 Tax=Magnolia sinica TaxID=86752 RepID=UPI002658A99C|nr:la protein 1-like [Magnolia sinica]
MAIAALDEEKAKNVIRQVEFYFSDSNLPRDNFLQKSIQQSDDGLVSLALICSFARMRSHLGLGTIKQEEVSDETVSSVAETLRKSQFLKISEDGKRVGRTTEMLKPEEVMEQVDIRTIAASPLEYTSKLEDVESFFSQYGKVNSVRLPRHVANKKCFCGTALIEFSTEEDANNVLKQSLVYAGTELELKPKEDFDSEREKLIEEFEQSPHIEGNYKKGSHVNENYPKGLIVAFKLKQMSKGGSIEHNGAHDEKENADPVRKIVEDPESTENIAEGSDQNTSKNVKDSEEKSLDGVDQENKEKFAQSHAEGSKEKAAEHAIQESEKKVAEDAMQESEEKAVEDAMESEEKAAEGATQESEEKAAEDAIQESEEKAAEDAIQESEEKAAGDAIQESEEKAAEDAIQESEEKAAGDAIQESEEKAENDTQEYEGKGTVAQEVVSREDLKLVFQRYGSVKYIDFRMGEESGYIRFEYPEAAQKARAAAVLSEECGLKVKSYIALLEAVTGDAERDYWSLLRNNQEKNRENKGHKGRGKNNKGGKHSDRKHSRPKERDSTEERPNKVQKVAAA